MAWDEAPPTKQELTQSSQSWDSAPPTPQELSQQDQNLGSRILSGAKNDIQSMANVVSRTGKGIMDLPSDLYQTGTQLMGGGSFNSTPIGQDIQTVGGAVNNAPGAILRQFQEIGAEPLKYIPGEMGNQFKQAYPENPLVEHPVNTVMALLPLAKPAFAAASELPGISDATEAVGNAVKGVKKAVLPPLLKSTKGIPTNVTRMAIDNPDVLNLPGTSESIQGKSQDIIDAIKGANREVGKEFGQTYAEQGMNSPVDEIINRKTPFKPILGNRQYNASGDLVNKTENIPGRSYQTFETKEVPATQNMPGHSYESSSGYSAKNGIIPNEITGGTGSQSVNIPGRQYSYMETKEAPTSVNIPGRSYTYTEQGPPKSVSTTDIKSTVSNSPSPKTFDELRNDYHSALSGDLFKKNNSLGSYGEMTEQEKLASLTDLKRSLQDQAIYPQPGQQLSPSQGAQNAAIKKMAADIDNLRGTIPGGDKLGLADDAYSEIKELSHRLMSAFKDPYTGQDYLNRILKGNTDWLTSGRMAGRVGALERIEQITGTRVLQPALKEIAAAYLNNPDVMGLPSTKISALLNMFIPAKTLLRGFNLNVPKSLFNAAPVSPSLLEQRPSQTPEPSPTNNGPVQFKQAAELPPQQQEQPKKYLDEKTARMYLDKSNGNKEQARAMATQDGWVVV